ncbi:MAG: LysR family transcriptional regulator [Rhizobium sp. 63-7]|mgnify:CR=1 FL=1|nr:MAG: LysR family transcriptional regulator [Rhizobium sp. 63-7]
MRLESDMLRTFVAVAETGNFTRAADLSGRTQSAVSIQIKKLEETIGDLLFERGSRGVTLTAKGRQLLGYARRVMALLDEAAASLKAPRLHGVVRIGIPEEYGHSILPKVLGRFDMMHPDVEVTVQYGSSRANAAALAKGELDIAVVFEQASNTHHEVLMTDPTVWVTSTIHETHRRSPVPVAMFAATGWFRSSAMSGLDDRTEPYRIAYVSDNHTGLAAAATSGLAIAPLSRSGIPEACRELTVADGYPIIDFSNVVLLVGARGSDGVVDGMANAIRDAFRLAAPRTS